MSKFLLKTILFIGPILIAFLFIEQQFKNLPNDYSYKAQYISKMGDSVKVLVLGSSHSYRGVNPEYFDRRCFNFAMVSQSIDYDCFILDKYIDDLPNLKYVILSISYFTFTEKLEEGTEYWRKYKYIHYLDYDNLTLKDKFSFATYFTVSQTSGKSVIKQLYNYWMTGENNIHCDKNGWGGWPSDIQKDLKITAREAAARHEDHCHNFEENLGYLDKIIQICIIRNIKILLFTPPVTPYYKENLDTQKWGLIASRCNSLESEYKNVRYLNLLNDSSFTNQLFKDGDHLNKKGAKVLSKKLNTEIKRFLSS